MTAINPFDWCWRKRRIAISGSAVLGIALLLPVPVGAQAEQDADLQAYCRAKHPNSFPQRIGLTHYCQEPGATGGAPRHNIDLAQACRMTTGSDSYRRIGSRVICAANTAEAPSQSAATTSGTPDFQAYCREKFPNSGYERRAEPWGVMHYCRRPGATGGFTLQAIDLADACQTGFGTSEFRLDGPSVACLDDGRPGTGAAQRPRKPDDQPPTRRDPVPPLPPQPDKPPLPPAPELTQATPGGDGLDLACQALGGEWRSGTLPLVDDILSGMERMLADRYASCQAAQNVQQCRNAAKVEQSVGAYFQAHMIWQCHAALVSNPPPEVGIEDIRLARDEGCAIEKTLTKLQDDVNSAGGAMQFAPHKAFLESTELDDLCAKGEIRFVRDPSAGGAVFDGETLPYSEPVFVEVEFDRGMKRSSRTLELKTASDAATVEVFQVSPQLYRSKEPIVLESDGDGVVRP